MMKRKKKSEFMEKSKRMNFEHPEGDGMESCLTHRVNKDAVGVTEDRTRKNHDIQHGSKREEKSTECHLCDKLKGFENDETFIMKLKFGSLFLHWNQSYMGRCLYIPNVHADDFLDIDYELFSNLNKEMLLICRAIERVCHPDLINFASLGNAVRHFHYHIIPRYQHDPNWGSPPWPAAEKKLTKEEYDTLIAMIRTELEEFHDREDSIPIKTNR